VLDMMILKNCYLINIIIKSVYTNNIYIYILYIFNNIYLFFQFIFNIQKTR